MGKTKTAFIGETTGDEKTKNKQKKSTKGRSRLSSGSEDKSSVRISGMGGGQRIKAIEVDMPVKPSDQQEPEDKQVQKKYLRSGRGKKYLAALTGIDKSKTYSLPEAIVKIKEASFSKFDGTLELHAVVKKQGLSVQSTLPHATGKQKVVEVADEKTITKLEAGKVDFDVLLSTPEMMPKLVKFARILGPRGMMPNPKNGTLIKTEAAAKNFSQNKITIKTERKAPVIHVAIGKLSLKNKDLEDNANAVFEALGKRQVLKAHLSATMSPSIKLNLD